MCLSAISQVSAEDLDNATLTDEIVTDDLQATESEEEISQDYKDFDEIQSQIESASEGDTIYISGVYKGSGTEITIDKSITIEGQSSELSNYTYLDADGQSRIFYITASNVVIKNVVFRNGDTSGNGGAMYGGSAYNCIFGFCHAYNGGAVYNTYAENCIFLANSATYGGAMYGGSAYNCAFGNNTASFEGGAVYFDGGSHSIINSDFENNTAYNRGGAVYSLSDVLTVSNSNFDNNRATSDDGGAIYCSGNNEVINLCNFRNNYAGDDGGAICGHSNLAVRNSYFYNNYAGYWGGAMRYGSAFDCSFVSNDARYRGGAMYEGNAYDCKFWGNTPENVYATSVFISIKPQIQISQSGSDFGSKTITVKVINLNDNNKPVSGATVNVKFSNGKTVKLTTNSNGIATYNVPFNPGTYRATASYNGASANLNNIKITKAAGTIAATKLSTSYGAKKYFTVKVINSKTKKAVGGAKLLLKVYTGKKAKYVYVTTASNGVAKYSASKLGVGNHKIVVSSASSGLSAKAKTSQIKVGKAATKTHAYDKLVVYKKSGKYYIGIANKNTGELIKGVKLTVKVFSGSKAKTYTVKTGKDGYASINTKSLSIGKHKVVVSFKGNSKFKASSAKAKIEVSKKIPTYMMRGTIFTTYIYGIASRMSVYIILKDINGNNLNKKITVTHSSGTTYTGTSNSYIAVAARTGVYTFRFAGDSKYLPSTYKLTVT